MHWQNIKEFYLHAIVQHWPAAVERLSKSYELSSQRFVVQSHHVSHFPLQFVNIGYKSLINFE